MRIVISAFDKDSLDSQVAWHNKVFGPMTVTFVRQGDHWRNDGYVLSQGEVTGYLYYVIYRTESLAILEIRGYELKDTWEVWQNGAKLFSTHNHDDAFSFVEELCTK
jgi:hypothetical protein